MAALVYLWPFLFGEASGTARSLMPLSAEFLRKTNTINCDVAWFRRLPARLIAWLFYQLIMISQESLALYIHPALDHCTGGLPKPGFLFRIEKTLTNAMEVAENTAARFVLVTTIGTQASHL